jgi:hypothetical protein
MGINRVNIDVVNWWQTLEKAKGSRPNWHMWHHYAELELLIRPFQQYTWAMWGFILFYWS